MGISHPKSLTIPKTKRPLYTTSIQWFRRSGTNSGVIQGLHRERVRINVTVGHRGTGLAILLLCWDDINTPTLIDGIAYENVYFIAKTWERNICRPISRSDLQLENMQFDTSQDIVRMSLND